MGMIRNAYIIIGTGEVVVDEKKNTKIYFNTIVCEILD
jgi:hypothetical protein